jgi:hypothetical protein
VQLGVRSGGDGTDQARNESSVERGLFGSLRADGRRHGYALTVTSTRWNSLRSE